MTKIIIFYNFSRCQVQSSSFFLWGGKGVGRSRPLWFVFLPSYWVPLNGADGNPQLRAKLEASLPTRDELLNTLDEDVAAERQRVLDGGSIGGGREERGVEDRVRILDLRKEFTSKAGGSTVAVDDLCFGADVTFLGLKSKDCHVM